jgi:hypothetical protein
VLLCTQDRATLKQVTGELPETAAEENADRRRGRGRGHRAPRRRRFPTGGAKEDVAGVEDDPRIGFLPAGAARHCQGVGDSLAAGE